MKIKNIWEWLTREPEPFLTIKSAEGKTVVVSDEDYEAGRERLLKAGMMNVRGTK